MINWEASEPLFALTHFDGRNGRKLTSLRRFFSEFAWMKKRLFVMVEYLLWTTEVLTKKKHSRMRLDAGDFSLSDAKKVQELEQRTNHDVKALELFLVSSLKRPRLSRLNLGIGSEDINSIAK